MLNLRLNAMPNLANDKISRLMNNPEEIRLIIQRGIHEALLRHKQAGNPVCESRNGRVVWVQPEDILSKKNVRR